MAEFVLDQSFALRSAAQADAVRLAERPQPAQFSLRGDPADPGFLAAAGAAFDLTLPIVPGQVAIGAAGKALWLGPDEWLLVAPRSARVALLERIEADLAGRHAAVVDLSDNRAVLALSGAPVRTLLAKGCGLDLDPRHFPVEQVKQSLIARIPAIIETVDGGVHLYVRRSFAAYLADWLLDAATEFA